MQEALKRVEIILEALALPAALDIVTKAGATGYTVIPQAWGRGARGERADLGFSAVLRNALIIVIAPASVAERIAAGMSPLLADYAGILTVGSVESCVGLDGGG